MLSYGRLHLGMTNPSSEEYVALGGALIGAELGLQAALEVDVEAAEGLEVGLHALAQPRVQPPEETPIPLEAALHGVRGRVPAQQREATQHHARVHGLLLPVRLEEPVEAGVPFAPVSLTPPVVLLRQVAHVKRQQRHRQGLLGEHVRGALHAALGARKRRPESRLHGGTKAREERQMFRFALGYAQHGPEIVGVLEEGRRGVAEERWEHGALQEAHHLEVAVRPEVIEREAEARAVLGDLGVGVDERRREEGAPHVQELHARGHVLEGPAHPVGGRNDRGEGGHHPERIAPARHLDGMV